MPRRSFWPWAKGVALLAVAMVLALARGDDLHHLRKAVAAALSPVGLLWLLLGTLVVLLWRRRQRRPAVIASACWAILSLAGNPQFAAYQFTLLEGPFASPEPGEEAAVDALLVLGGGVAITTSGRVTVGAAVERLTMPLRLYRQGVTTTLVTSGPLVVKASPAVPAAPLPPPSSYPQAVAGIWTALGVSSEHIILVEGPRTTKEEIEAHRRLVAERGWRRVGLVTSAWHMRRALRHCRRVGLEVVPLPCDVRGDPPRWRWRHLIPSSAALENTTAVWIETLALLAGR